MADHRHTNPSPSHEVGAWCNGTADDHCFQFVPLSSFTDGPHESYLQDSRYIGQVFWQGRWWDKVDALIWLVAEARWWAEQQRGAAEEAPLPEYPWEVFVG